MRPHSPPLRLVRALPSALPTSVLPNAPSAPHRLEPSPASASVPRPSPPPPPLRRLVRALLLRRLHLGAPQRLPGPPAGHLPGGGGERSGPGGGPEGLDTKPGSRPVPERELRTLINLTACLRRRHCLHSSLTHCLHPGPCKSKGSEACSPLPAREILDHSHCLHADAPGTGAARQPDAVRRDQGAVGGWRGGCGYGGRGAIQGGRTRSAIAGRRGG